MQCKSIALDVGATSSSFHPQTHRVDDHRMKGKTMVDIQLSFSASNCIDDQIKNEERNEEKKFYSHHKVYIENWLFEESNSLL